MQISSISAKEFKLLNKNNQLTIVDVRTPVEVANEYLLGSLFLPLQVLTPEKFNQIIPTASNESTTHEPIYLLCQRGIRAHTAVKKLKGVNNIHLIVIEGGLNELKDKGQVVKKGISNIISLDRQVHITSGVLILIVMLFGVLFHPSFYAITLLMGIYLVVSGITNTCALCVMLSKMPWNRLK